MILSIIWVLCGILNVIGLKRYFKKNAHPMTYVEAFVAFGLGCVVTFYFIVWVLWHYEFGTFKRVINKDED